MKKDLEISFTESENNELPYIFLGIGEPRLKHKSKTFLKLYIRRYKKVLKDNIRILNSYNTQVYSLFRTFYFELPSLECERINKAFYDFNKALDWIFSNIGGNQNSIFFHKIEVCIIMQTEILVIMKSHSHRHKIYALKNQSEALLKMTEEFRKDFERDKCDLDLTRDYADKHLELVRTKKQKQKNVS